MCVGQGAAIGFALVLPFTRDEYNVLTVDRVGADWALVPLTQLGSHVTVAEHPSRAGACVVVGVPNESKGGPIMQPVKVTSKMYAATAINVQGEGEGG